LKRIDSSKTPFWRDGAIWDATEALQHGNNVLLIQVSPERELSKDYLLAALDWNDTSGSQRLGTNSQWEYQAEENDSWQPVVVVDGVWAEPNGIPLQAPSDFLRMNQGNQRIQEQMLKSPILIRSGVGSLIQDPRGYLFSSPSPFPLEPPELNWKRIGKHITLQSSREEEFRQMNEWLSQWEARSPVLLYRIDSETFGRVRVRNLSEGPVLLATTLGESLEECDLSTTRFTQAFRLDPQQELQTSLSGFRWIKLILLGAKNQALISSPMVDHLLFPATDAGRFECSDPLLQQIWNTGQRTIHLCLQNTLWDGIKGRLAPIPESLYIEALALYSALGEWNQVKRTLHLLPCEMQRTDIAWWLITLKDYWYHTGDIRFLQSVAHQILSHVNTIVSTDPEPIPWDFLEESETYRAGNILSYGALISAMISMKAVSPEETHHIEKAIQRRRRLFMSSWDRSLTSFGTTLPVNALVVALGVSSMKQAEMIMEKVLGYPDPSPMPPACWSTIMEALSSHDRDHEAFQILNRIWGGMIRLGATTFWERFDPAWAAVEDIHGALGGHRVTLCHGSSSGPTSWIGRWILGIRPASPGFERVWVNPKPTPLLWAEGSIPTPRGRISVSISKSKGKTQVSVAIPPQSIGLIPGKKTRIKGGKPHVFTME